MERKHIIMRAIGYLIDPDGKYQKKERGTILDKAKETINGARQDAYGNPEDSFSTIAKLWTAYTGIEFTPHDVAMMMALLKVARIKGGAGSEDSYIDLCGYAALAADMWRQEKGE